MLNIIFFSLVSLANAAIYLDGPCPEVKPLDNINITAFTARPWYEIAKYSSDMQDNAECAFDSFKYENGIVKLKFSEVVNRTLHVYNGVIDYDPNTHLLNYKSGDFQAEEKVNIFPVYGLAIDYNSYFICFECKYDKLKNQRHEYAWIMSRTKYLTKDAKVAVDNYLKSSPIIDKAKLIWNKFDAESCKVEN